MQRRKKGQKRSSGNSNTPNDALSPERMEFLLDQNAQEVEENLESSAKETIERVDNDTENFKNTPDDILTEANNEEKDELLKLNSEAEDLAQQTKEEIEEIQWGRSAKKSTPSQHFEPGDGPLHSAQPKNWTNKKSEKTSPVPENINPETSPEIPKEEDIPTINRDLEIPQNIEQDDVETENNVEQKSFNEFFVNLKLEDFEDTEKLREQFDAMMEDPTFLEQFGIEPGMEYTFQNLKDKYFENFITQAEALLKENIAITQHSFENSSKKEKTIAGLKKEGKKFLKGIWGGSAYAMASKAIMFGTRFIGGPASSVVKIAAGGVTGAAVSGFNFMLGKGFQKLNEKSLKKLASQAEEMQNKGLDQKAIFAQLQEDMWALSEYDRQQKEDLETQQKESFKLKDEEIDKVFTGENIDDKRQKLDNIQKLFFRTTDIHKDGKSFKEVNIKERQEIIKDLLENNTLEEYTVYRISKTIEKLMADKDLSETDIRNITLQAELLVDREMNSILGDVVAQEKFEEISGSQKKNFKDSYVAKLFGKNPPETMMQALSKGFVSGSMAGIASDAGAGAIYMGMQRLQGSLRAEILKKSASEIKTSRDIIQELDNFQLTGETFNQAEDMILDARARIKLPDIKEVDRAKIELRLKGLQNKMIRQAEVDNIIRDNDQDLEDLAKNIISQRALAIEKASDIAKAEKARKGLKGLWKTFAALSRQEKMKVIAKAGIEGAKGAIAGGVGAEIVGLGSAATMGEDYDIETGIKNVVNRATFGALGTSTETMSQPKDSNETSPVDTTEASKQAAPEVVDDNAYEADLDNADVVKDDTYETDLNQEKPEIKIPKPIDEEYDIDSLEVDENDLVENTDVKPKVEIPKPIEEEDFDIDGESLVDQEKTIDLTKDINSLNERLGIDILDGEPSSEELHKVICELDNDPKSLEASQAREAIKQLIDQGLLTEKDYTYVVARHIGEELHLGNEEIVKNAIDNSSLNVKTVVETQAKVALEKSIGVNTFDGELTKEDLDKINLVIHSSNSQEAIAYLQKLHADSQISNEEKFNMTHPSAEHTGFKQENTVDDEENVKYNLSLELGKDQAPRYLEQVFYRVGIDHIEIDNENVTNLEAARILNIGANMRVLSEGHDVAGVSAEEFSKYVTIDGNKVQINDYEAFQANIIDKLADHSEEIITTDNLDNVGAVAYIDNIKNETWGDMLSPAQVEPDNINFDQAQIDKAEVRLFQGTLESTELGELVTDIEFKNESSGTFVLDNETIEVKNNEVVQIGDTPLLEPIVLEDKESGQELLAKTAEVKAEKFLSYLEDRQEEMLQRLSNLDDLSNQKIEITEPDEPMSEYQINTQLNETLDRLGIRNGLNNPEWDSLKQESVNYLLDENNLPEIHDAKEAVSLHHREQVRQLLDNAISKGELKVTENTSVEEAMKELAAQSTREKLIKDISIAEQRASRSLSETLGDQLREMAQAKEAEMTQTEQKFTESPLESKTSSPQWLSPEHKAEMNEMMPDGWNEKDIPMYMREDEGRAHFDDNLEEENEEKNIQEYAKEAAPVIYSSLLDKELPVDKLDSLNKEELTKLKIELENISAFLKEGPPEDSIITPEEARAVDQQYQNIISEIEQQLTKNY